MHKVFITGSSIICALGNNKKESINKLKNINNKNYKEYLKENFEDINYYKIKQNFKTQKEKFFSILEKTILDAINDAKLSKEDRENLHIYLSSTSMNISLIEESFSITNSIHAINFEEILYIFIIISFFSLSKSFFELSYLFIKSI
jgi:3-oxoacyl-[acyl-carrier-protein] synthase-1